MPRRSTRPDRRSSSTAETASTTRYWGWHRLTADWADRLVDQARIRPGTLVLDLGAGDGALTAPLVRAGAQVIAVELHRGRADGLRERFADEPSVRVLQLDLQQLRLPSRPFTVVANPPWSLAKPLIRLLTARDSRMTHAELVLQRGLVGDLDARGDPGPGRHRFRASYAGSIPRKAFRPAPPSPAALLSIHRSRRHRPAPQRSARAFQGHDKG